MTVKYIRNILLLALLPIVGIGQQVTFEAFTDAKQVLKGAYFEVTFTLKNARGTSFKPPSFNRFDIVSGPSQSVSSSYVNGKVSQEMSYTYGLVAKKEGRFNIGTAIIVANGKSYRTRAILIEVLASNKKVEANANKLFAVAILKENEIWEGQQLPLLYKLYFSNVRISNIGILAESEYDGFFAQIIRNTDLRNIREIINGVQYEGRIVKKMVLFPQRTGDFTLDPFTLQISIIKGQNGFFRRNIINKTISTNPIKIKVKPLPPADVSSQFSGAVGIFSISSSINKRNISTDDAITLVLKITGNGDIKRIHAPDIELPKGFELYDPSTLKENTFISSEGMLISEKTFEYIIAPNEVGTFKITPTFTYFDTDSAKYITLANQVFDLTVRQGTNKPRDISVPVVQQKLEDIHNIQIDTHLHKKGDNFFQSTFFWILCMLPILVLLGGFLLKKQQTQQANLDPTAIKHKRAKELALKKLETAKKLKETKKSHEFYTEISSAMFGYVCDKLHIPISALNKENLTQQLESLQIKDQIIQNFMQVITNCETALYAGMDNSAAMDKTFETSLQLLTEMEEGLS